MGRTIEIPRYRAEVPEGQGPDQSTDAVTSERYTPRVIFSVSSGKATQGRWFEYSKPMLERFLAENID